MEAPEDTNQQPRDKIIVNKKGTSPQSLFAIDRSNLSKRKKFKDMESYMHKHMIIPSTNAINEFF